MFHNQNKTSESVSLYLRDIIDAWKTSSWLYESNFDTHKHTTSRSRSNIHHIDNHSQHPSVANYPT